MFKSLYRKLAVALFGIVCLVGLVFFWLAYYSANMYQQEVAQKLNVELAEHMVAEQSLLNNQQVNHKALEHLFHGLMVINPSIELYLLDTGGKILAFSAPAGKVKLQRVDLDPIARYLSGNTSFPLNGDDPRGLSRKKVFSAAKITVDGAHQGYLYIILGSELFDNAVEMIQQSYIFRFTLFGLGATLILAFSLGLFAFSYLTQRFSLLANTMDRYRIHRGKTGHSERYPIPTKAHDEIDRLGINFNYMADRIEDQINELRATDAKRRELVANVSHDLRTPLTALTGYLETLLLKGNSLTEKERQQYLEIATNQSKQLGDLVTELFELAKLDSCESLINIESFSLGELIQDIVHKFTLRAGEKGIAIVADFGHDIPFAYGDIGLMQRALDNLIENAMRHTPKGGEITLALTANPEKITVKVTDNGCGVSKDELPHIFDRFYRLQKSRADSAKNAGLGLAIVKRIIDLHGCNIVARSKPQQGTTFTFDVPAYQA